MMTHEPAVVVTGLGVASPIGSTLRSFWQCALQGVSGTNSLPPLTLGTPQGLRGALAGQVTGVPREPAHYPGDRMGWLARWAADAAMRDAGLLDQGLGEGGGLVVATAVGGTAVMEAGFPGVQVKASGVGPAPDADRDLWASMVFDTVTQELADVYDLEGPAVTVSTGCTAGVDAVGMAMEMIRGGEADAVLVGASEAPLCPIVYAAFDALGTLSTHVDKPTAASRPFDRSRNGFVLAEGAAFLVLESADHARARGARVQAGVSGFASRSNATHMTDLPEFSDVLCEAMRGALDDANLQPEDLDHISAHGSATQQNDLCETNAIKRVFGTAHSGRMTVNALKSMIGHALGASNAIEIVAAVLSLREQVHHPTINLTEPGQGCDLDYVPQRARRARCQHLMKVSNGFSGIHSALVLSAPQAAVA